MGNLFRNLAIIVIGLVIIWTVVYLVKKNPEEVSQTSSQETTEMLSPEEASEKVMDFINNNILRGNIQASLVDVLKEKGLYKVTFNIEGQEQDIDVYLTLDGKLFFPDAIDLTKVEKVAVAKATTIGDFKVSDEEICRENNKPVVYFFGSEGCPHCRWQHPIVEKVVQKFGEEITFHNNMDTDDDQEIFRKYSTGGIPTMVFGCKYYKTGSGEPNGEEKETKILTALICKLTNNKPQNVCNEVQDLVTQIKT